MDTLRTTRGSLIDSLYVVFKRKSQILLFFGATVCTVGIATFFIKPTYEASSQILVKIGRENLYVPTVPASSNVNPVINFNREEQINSEIEIFKGRSLAEQVAEFLGPTTIYKDLKVEGGEITKRSFPQDKTLYSLLEEASLRIQKALEVEGVNKSNVIEVRFKHDNPDMAATVVNKLVDFFLDRHLDIHKTPQSYKFFKHQSELLKNQLMLAEANLKNFKKQHNITSLEEERTLLLKQLANLGAALNETLSQEAETESRVHQLHQQLASIPETVPQGEEIDHNPYLISTLEARLVELELKEQELLTKYTEQSRFILNAREEIRIVRDKLNEQEKKRYGKSRSGLNVIYQHLQEELLRNEAELKALKAKQEIQSGQLSEYQRKIGKLNQNEVELNQLQQEANVNQRNYQLYLSKFEESRISRAMDAEKIANVTLLEPARRPHKPVKPRVKLNMALAVFLGTFGGLGLAFFFEYFDDSLEKAKDVEEGLELPVLALIPEFTR